MSFTKVKAYNHALSALLLSKQVVNTETDNSNEVRVLNQFWEEALTIVLQQADLDSLSESMSLELITELDVVEHQWKYAYKYPSRCAFLRRIRSHVTVDTYYTGIDKTVKLYMGQKAIYTNQPQAKIEFIPNDITLTAFNPQLGLAVSYYLAFLSSPLITGKGAKALSESIYQKFILALNGAREIDARENFNFQSPAERSEFVAARLSGY